MNQLSATLFKSTSPDNPLNIVEEVIVPVFQKKISEDRKHWKMIKSLFLSAMKEGNLGFIKRHVLWYYVNYSITNGIKNQNSLFEIEKKAKAFFEKRLDFEKTIKPASIKRAKQNYNKIKEYILGEHILDLGAGDGLTSLEIIEKMNKSVILADVIDCNLTDLPLIQYPQGGRVPLEDQSVDCTILYCVLHHCNNPAHVLKEAARVTKKRLIIMEGYCEDKDIAIKNSFFDWYVNRVVRVSDVNVPLNYTTIKNWKFLLNEAGFGASKIIDMGIDEPVAPEHHVLIIADKI